MRAPAGYEADPKVYACPNGPYCEDPFCIAENARRRTGFTRQIVDLADDLTPRTVRLQHGTNMVEIAAQNGAWYAVAFLLIRDEAVCARSFDARTFKTLAGAEKAGRKWLSERQARAGL